MLLDISDLRNPVYIGRYDAPNFVDYATETLWGIFLLQGGILWLIWRRKYRPKDETKITENGGILDYIKNLWRKYMHRDENKNTSREVELSMRILKTLQQVRSNIPLQLSRLSQLVDLPIKKTEKLVLEILSQDPGIGEYSPLEQVFIKKSEITEANISSISKPTDRIQACTNCGSSQSVLIRRCSECNSELPFCQICKRGFASDEVQVKCPHCNNAFHKNHLLEYIKIKGECPACKNILKSNNL